MRQVDRFQRDLHQYVHTDAVRASEAAAPELFQMGRPVPEVPFPTCELCVTSLPPSLYHVPCALLHIILCLTGSRVFRPLSTPRQFALGSSRLHTRCAQKK